MAGIIRNMGVGKMVRLGTNSNQIPTANLVQRLFKDAQPLSSNLGTKAIDYSPVQVNANIWQSCLYPPVSAIHYFDAAIIVNMATDGLKHEFIACLKPGTTSSIVIGGNGTNHGVKIGTTMLQMLGYRSNQSTVADIQFTSITTAADDVWYRYRITRVGANLIAEKTIPSDVNYTDVGKISQSIDVSALSLGNQTFANQTLNGGICYLNCGGTKFAFAEGEESKFSVSYTSPVVRIYKDQVGNRAVYQNVYCHNAIYGYSRVNCKYISSEAAINISYDENSQSTLSKYTTGTGTGLITRWVSEEFPANKSLGYGYAIKLDSSMLGYDQANSFFSAGLPKLLRKCNIPSKLNSRIFFDHQNNADLLIYSADKTLIRSINTANEGTCVIGDSMANYLWQSILSSKLLGSNQALLSYSGKKLSTEIETLLRASIASAPTTLSSKKIIFLTGGFNDYILNVSDATFQAGIASLFAYIRSQNPTAHIICAGVYNWGLPIDTTGEVANTAGMTRNSMRLAMSNLVAANNTKTHYINWNDAGIVQEDLFTDGLHLVSNVGSYKVAKLHYDQILTLTD